MRLYVFAFVALVGITIDAHSQDLERAQSLHDTHCITCHDTKVYTRSNRVARDYSQVLEQTDRWQKNASLNWAPADVAAVAQFIAARYYKLECGARC